MDFALKHIRKESVATLSKIRYIPIDDDDNDDNDGNDGGNNSDADGPASKRQKTIPPSAEDAVVEGGKEEEKDQTTTTIVSSTSESQLDKMLIRAANKAAIDLFQTPNPDSSLFPERITPQTDTIQPDQLVVIFESFDNLNFCYAKRGEIFSNRNGHFHHNDFIGKPYGCKIRSRNNQGYGYVFLLKPTPELWARSLKHRTQIVHELDASMIVFYLNLRPNMIVCESGTGSGALSHCILRTIAPSGHLFTYEFNQLRAEAATKEFAKNRVDHLVTVIHKDVCGSGPIITTTTSTSPNQTTKLNKDNDGRGKEATATTTAPNRVGGFDRPQASVDAIVLDLPQPWLAVPHAAYCLKPNSRIASYSPCVEQSQRTVETLTKYGFHSITTKEFRLKEFHVAEEEYEFAPKEMRPRPLHLKKKLSTLSAAAAVPAGSDGNRGTASNNGGGDDTGAEADNERSEYETEGDQDMETTTEQQTTTSKPSAAKLGDATNSTTLSAAAATKNVTATKNNTTTTAAAPSSGIDKHQCTKKVLVARPFSMMRGHTAFLTFATAGNMKHPDPNNATMV